MKINELKRIAKENDYKLENKHNQLEHKLEFRRNAGGLENILNQIAIREGIENRIFFDINYCDEKDFNMIKAAVEFAETPLEDREEEKKFYLEHKYFKCINGDSRYFQIYEPNGNPWLNAMDSTILFSSSTSTNSKSAKSVSNFSLISSISFSVSFILV